MMKGDRLRCRGCGRYRSRVAERGDGPDDKYADYETEPCDLCGTETAVLA